jgi:NADP-dependent 3-hydroxy acid dehydrogenase YdfG
VVIGASSGIGAATARTFVEAGAHVHAAARRKPSLGEGILGHELDVVDRAGVEAFAQTLTAQGPVHAIVVAAGTNLPDRTLDRLTPKAGTQWSRPT